MADNTPKDFVLYVKPSKTSHQSSEKGTNRLSLVAGFISAVALVAIIGSAGNWKSNGQNILAQSSAKSAQAALRSPNHDKETLAATILTSVLHSTPEKMMHVLRTWRDHQIANLDPFGSSQMLRQERSVTTILDDSSSGICASKTVVIDKLNGLAAKLVDDIQDLNATDAAKLKAKNDAYQAWLDTESEYRLMDQKQQDAKEGASYAGQKYEKWAEAVQDTQKRYDELLAAYNSAKLADGQEKALLESIVELLSKINTLKSTDEPALKMDDAQLQAKVGQLKQLAAKAKNLQLAALASKDLSPARLTRLAGAGEIIDLIKGIIAQLEQHDSALAADVASAESDLTAHKAKLEKYQQDVVDLSNAADKAHNEAQVAKLKRQNLAGTKVSAEEDYTAEHDAYNLSLPPLQEEYAVLQAVIAKVQAACP